MKQRVDEAQEHRLAVITGWAFFGSFGLCLIISGFAEDSMLAGLVGLRRVAGPLLPTNHERRSGGATGGRCRVPGKRADRCICERFPALA